MKISWEFILLLYDLFLAWSFASIYRRAYASSSSVSYWWYLKRSLLFSQKICASTACAVINNFINKRFWVLPSTAADFGYTSVFTANLKLLFLGPSMPKKSWFCQPSVLDYHTDIIQYRASYYKRILILSEPTVFHFRKYLSASIIL